MPKRSSKNPDANQVAFAGMQSLLEKLDPESRPKPKEKNPAAVALGKLGGAKGGAKGGAARAAKLSARERSAIAKKAARTRWQGEAS